MRGGHAYGSSTAKYTADGQTIVTFGNDNTMKYFRAPDGMLLKTIVPFTWGWEDFVLSPDGEYFRAEC